MSTSDTIAMERHGLETGNPQFQSVGPITFGPDGILFVADSQQATIFAIATDDGEAPAESRPVNVDRLDSSIASYLGCSRADVHLHDMAVHPISEAVYLSVTRGAGDAALPLILRLDADGNLSELPTENVAFAQAAVEDAPSADDERQELRVLFDDEEGQVYESPSGISIKVGSDPLRSVTITDMAYADGELIVAGASNEEFASTLRRIPFPFSGKGQAGALEIFHVSHGKWETHSPIRSFVPYGGDAILASYTCTPVVHFSLADLQPGGKATGRTVAELGAMNTPIDMVSYSRDGEEYLLVSNTRHPLIKIAARDIPGQAPLTEPREPVGVPREDLPLEGVGRMANLNGSFVLMMHRGPDGLNLRSHSTAAL